MKRKENPHTLVLTFKGQFKVLKKSINILEAGECVTLTGKKSKTLSGCEKWFEPFSLLHLQKISVD